MIWFWRGVLGFFIGANALMIQTGTWSWKNVVGIVCCSVALVANLVIRRAR